MSELTAAASHLLEMLAAEGAYGFCPEPDEPGILAVVGRRNGISLRQGSASLAVAKELEKDKLALWRSSARSRRRRFILTNCGWAKLVETAMMSSVAAFATPDESPRIQAEAEACP